jgi:hypothetical protein
MIIWRSIVLYHSMDGGLKEKQRKSLRLGRRNDLAVDWMERVYNWVGLLAFV